MIYILDIIACGLVVLAELIGVLILAILTQFIFYRVFKINLYKRFAKLIFELDKKAEEIFG